VVLHEHSILVFAVLGSFSFITALVFGSCGGLFAFAKAMRLCRAEFGEFSTDETRPPV
jgi:hypothetical protein